MTINSLASHITSSRGSRQPCARMSTADATYYESSPHIVIRGETSSAPPQTALIDWLAFTLTLPPEAAQFPHPIAWLLNQLIELLNLPPVSFERTGKGWNGYTERLNIGENSRYGLIAFGGDHQRGTVHVELNARACALVPDWYILQQWGESLGAKITRVDLAHDDMKAEVVSIATARAWYEAGEFTSSGRPPAAKLIDDMGSGKGKTLYIGKRANGKVLRVYEKGRQLGDPSSPWVRVELELHNKSRLIPWDVLITPTTYLAGGYPCLAFLAIVQDKIRTISKAVQITIGSMVQYLRTVGGKSIHVLMQVHFGDAFAVINAIKREGVPRRLRNYADFMPNVLYGDLVST